MTSCGLSGDELREQRIAEGAMLWNGVLPRVQSVDMRQQVSTCDDYKRDVTLALIDYDKKYPDQLNNFLALPTKEESDPDQRTAGQSRYGFSGACYKADVGPNPPF